MSWACTFFFPSRGRHTRLQGAWSSDVCSADLGGGLLDVKDVVNDLESPADGPAESPQARDIFGAGPCAQGPGRYRSTDERSGFRAVNVLQHLLIDVLTLGFEVSDLATYHSVDSSGRSGHFRENGGAALRGGGCRSDGLERQR